MKITKVVAREIYDSRGLPTVECQLFLGDVSVFASVPSGASTGSHEAHELRDGGKRLMGKGVLKAIKNIETIIAPTIIDKDPNLFDIDMHLIELDGTANKERLGANAILAVSMAVARAQALVENMELYELLARLYGSETVTLPFPLINMINGGAHADNGLRIQEFMVMPMGGQNFREAFEVADTVFHTLKEILKKNGKSTAVGDEGGFASSFDNEIQALDFLAEAIEKTNSGDVCRIALDIAASQFYDSATGIYNWNGTKYSSQELIDLYSMLIIKYPIFSIEDGLSEEDWDGWVEMVRVLGEAIQLVGDDIFVTNPHRIMHGIKAQAANAVLIKPNQIGTITQTLQAIQVCQENGMGTIISHRSGETEDTFIADLAVATSAGQIKAGGCCRGERLAKYNRLLRIEDQLMMTLLES